jgi:hypothetical protein
MTKPITPKDVESIKAARMRPEMIEAANELIAEKWNGYNANFTVAELCARARLKLKMEAKESFQDGELDIEVVFRKHGWRVEFDRPGYNEMYDAHWIFTKKKAG